jgi:hypothetical protein
MVKICQTAANYTKRQYIIPNNQKLFQMVKKYNNIFHSKSLQIYPNWNFWYENKPSGNPSP